MWFVDGTLSPGPKFESDVTGRIVSPRFLENICCT